MNPEENKQPPAPQSEPNQPAPEGPVVQDVVAPPPEAQSQQSSANPEVKQPPEDQQNAPPAPDNPDAPEPTEPKSTVSLGGESSPVTEDDTTDSAGPEDATAPTKPQKQPKTKTSSNLPIGFIVATVIMALVLMGLVVMMYMNQEAEAPASPDNTMPTSEPATELDYFDDNTNAEEETITPDSTDESATDESPETEETDGDSLDDSEAEETITE